MATEEAFIAFAKRRLQSGAKHEEVATGLRVNGLSDQEIAEILFLASGGTVKKEEPEPAGPPSPWLSTEPVSLSSKAPTQTPPKPAPPFAAPPVQPLPLSSPLFSPPPAPASLPPKPPLRPLPSLPKLELRPQTAPDVPDPPVLYAGLLRRLAAAIIDAVVLVLLILGSVAAYLISTANLHPSLTLQNEIGLAIYSLLLVVLYHPLLETTYWRGSVGKYLIGLEVVDVGGHQLSFPRALGRAFARILSVATIVGFLMTAFTKKKQGLHDMLTKTLVVRAHTSRFGTVLMITALLIGVPVGGFYLLGLYQKAQSQLNYSGGQIQSKNAVLQDAIKNTPD